MKVVFKNAWGYQGDAMNLPVADVESAISFYVDVMGFDILSRSDLPNKSAVLGRDDVKIAIAENGRDPEQDGCAFEVDSAEAAFAEFKASGLDKKAAEFKTENNHGATWKVFYVVAPDGLCYWLGEKQSQATL